MGQARKLRLEFLKRNPTCCFCGGDTPASTLDHQPGRVFFKDRQWPENFVFPACQSCNAISSDSEELLAVLLHGESDNVDRTRYLKLISSINDRYPDLASDLTNQSANDNRRLFRKYNLTKPAGLAFGELPLIRMDSSFWDTHIDHFSRKLLLAIHYQCFGKIVPPEGGVSSRFFTNFDWISGNIPEKIADLPKKFVSPTRNKQDLSAQFSITYNNLSEYDAGIFVCQFHGRALLVGFTSERRDLFDEVGTFFPPYGCD